MMTQIVGSGIRVAFVAVVFSLLQVGCTTVEKQPEPVVGFAIFPPLQYPLQGGKIDANRTSILLGRHASVTGYDLTFGGNITDKEFNGLATALGFNVTRGKTNVLVLQLAGLFNSNTGDARIYGFQIAGLANTGAKTKIYGFQVGLYNEAETIYGFQIGLINKTKTLYGVQVGLANISYKNGLPFFPVINVGF